MDARMNPHDLKTALAEVLAGIRKSERDKLTAALHSALDKFSPSEELTAGLIDIVRALLVRADVPTERLEHLLELVEQAVGRGRHGRPLKEAALSVDEVMTVAAVDALMDTDKSLGLERACREVAKKTKGHFTWKKLKDLRANIMRGKPYASAEAAECYRWRRRADQNPFTEEMPAPISLDDVEKIWASRAAKKT